MMEPKFDNVERLQDDMYTGDNRDHVEMDMERSDEEENQDSQSKDDQDHLKCSDGYKNTLNETSKDINPDKTNIIQIANVSPSATVEHLSTLFGYLGDIVDLKIFQSDLNSDSNMKVCFVEFAKPSSVSMAKYLTNTVLIDRALVVLPYYQSRIPDRDTALASVGGANISTKFNPGVMSQLSTGVGGVQVITTTDPRLTALGLPQYPQLPVNTEPTRIEEIRRTLYIGNLDSTITPDQVLKFFNDIGEVKYIRMAGDDTQPTRFAFVEFTHQSSVADALQHNGSILGGRPLKINHSNNAIVKPQPKIEQDDVSKRVRDNRSRSRDYSSRDRYSSRYERDRDRVRDRDRDRDRSYHDRRVSPRDHRSRRSRSREALPSRRRSRSRGRSRRSRSKDRNVSRRSRSRDSKRKRSKSRSSERTRSRHRKSSRR